MICGPRRLFLESFYFPRDTVILYKWAGFNAGTSITFESGRVRSRDDLQTLGTLPFLSLIVLDVVLLKVIILRFHRENPSRLKKEERTEQTVSGRRARGM